MRNSVFSDKELWCIRDHVLSVGVMCLGVWYGCPCQDILPYFRNNPFSQRGTLVSLRVMCMNMWVFTVIWRVLLHLEVAWLLSSFFFSQKGMQSHVYGCVSSPPMIGYDVMGPLLVGMPWMPWPPVAGWLGSLPACQYLLFVYLFDWVEPYRW